MSFLSELKRRNVFKVAAAYSIVAWLVVQVAATTFTQLQLPAWSSTLVTAMVVLGFPIAVLLAWAYELSPKGVQRTSAIQEKGAPPQLESALAVFPFKNLTANSPYGFLADAIPMELQNSLSRVPQLRVVSGQSASAHGASKNDLPSIAAALNVQYVISGSVAHIGDRLRIMTTLDDATRDAMLWSHTYDASVEDLLAVQQQIAESIVGAFGGERLRAEVVRANSAETKNPAAWQLVQKARVYLLNYNADTVAEAIPLIEKAVKLDPGYAEGHAALGLIIAERTLNGISADPAADREAALHAVEHARRLAPQDSVVLRAAGAVHAYAGQYRKAIELLRIAVAKAPFDLGAWGYFGWPLVATGNDEDFTELNSILDRLLTAAPKHPGSAYWKFHKSVVYSCEGKCERALEYAEQATSEQPRFALAWMNYANLLGRLGMHDRARAAVERCHEANPRMTVSYYEELMSVLTDQESVIASRTMGLREAKLLPVVTP
jgi:TolB-like protein/Tfp pilus assembly protein PilF